MSDLQLSFLVVGDITTQRVRLANNHEGVRAFELPRTSWLSAHGH